MTDDAQRIAKRFVEVRNTFDAGDKWEDMTFEHRRLLIQVFDEMVRAELIFPGPSLYAAL
jgi:hypothetical protein